MDHPETTMITKSLPAILIGGAPKAGKSVLTYNITKELRRREVPHYVFRASPDYEGDWFLDAESEEVTRQIYVKDEKVTWSDTFRQLICQDLPRRLLPLIVDIGGLPTDKDNCIFLACTHSLLLLKESEEQATQTWHHYTTINGLTPFAELHSLDPKKPGKSVLTSQEAVIQGTITGLERHKRIHGPVFEALIERISQLFSSYPPEELERLHMDAAKGEFVVHLRQRLHELAPDTEEWTPDLLQPLLSELPTQTALSVYERGPVWLYGALALHAKEQPLYQFDPRLNWVSPPLLKSSASAQSSQSLMHIEQHRYGETYTITIRPVHSYLDYIEADQLVFPEPPPNCGVIVSGKLPLWLFTALARFYAQRNVPWIALNYARTNEACVIYSHVPEHTIGEVFAMLG